MNNTFTFSVVAVIEIARAEAVAITPGRVI